MLGTPRGRRPRRPSGSSSLTSSRARAPGAGLGRPSGIVLNTGGGVEAAPEEVISADPIATDAYGGSSVTMEEVGPIELNLGTARGNMLVEGEPHALLIGSTLQGGVFYWQPGPAIPSNEIANTNRW